MTGKDPSGVATLTSRAFRDDSFEIRENLINANDAT
jgi:hypothetical protein